MLYRFGEFELDEGTRQLKKAGGSCHVEPKVMDLLLFLVRHRERAVSRSMLVRELWSDVAVSHAALTRLVKEARRVLGDGGRSQAIIRTLHARGYQFVAAVDVRGDDADGETMRTLEMARLSLEDAMDRGARDVRERIREFVSVCEAVVRRSERAPKLGR